MVMLGRLEKINNVCPAIGARENSSRPTFFVVSGLADSGAVEFEISLEAARELAARLITNLPPLSLQAPPPCVQGPSGRYLLPLAIQVASGIPAGIEGQARILLGLEGEYVLEVPATQEAIDELYQTLGSLTTRR